MYVCGRKNRTIFIEYGGCAQDFLNSSDWILQKCTPIKKITDRLDIGLISFVAIYSVNIDCVKMNMGLWGFHTNKRRMAYLEDQ